MSTKDVPIKLTDGKERVLRFDWGALCRFEREFGYSVIDVGAKLGGGKVSFLDATNVIYAGLLHEEKPMSLAEVQELLVVDDFFDYLKAMGEAIAEAIPEEKKSAKKA